MGKFNDLTGKSFNRWNVIKRADSRHGVSFWECECSCSDKTRKSVRATNLIDGSSQSCGCYKSERSIKNSTKHGLHKTRIYSIWWNMKQRCYYKKNPRYHRYGGRGITVCEKWMKVEGFYEDMGDPPDKTYTLHRINNDGNYCKDNCIWADKYMQANNRITNYFITIGEETKTIAEWSRIYGIQPNVAGQRIKNGVSPIKAFTDPVKSFQKGYKRTEEEIENIRQKTINYFENNPDAIDKARKRMLKCWENKDLGTDGTDIEKIIGELLKKLNIEFKYQFILGNFVYDFYLSKFKTIIECNSLYWHKDTNKDQNKNEFALRNGYNLLVYWDCQIKSEKLKEIENEIRKLQSLDKILE